MNKVALSALAVSIAGFAIVTAQPGCSTTSTSNPPEEAGTDTGGGSSSGSSSSSSGMGSSSGTMMDSGEMDTSAMETSMESSTEGGVCPAPATGSTACNTCIDQNCNMQWCTCAADTTVDDAGTATGGCAAFVQCVSVCAGMPGNTGPGCVGSCSASDGGASGGPYTQTDISDGTALLACIASNCTAAPDGGDAGDAGAACQP
jgi:hypothetical protein